MPSSDGLPEQRLDRLKDWHLSTLSSVDPVPLLTVEEQDRLADGEPYCFRCGKPASSFGEYRSMVDPPESYDSEAEFNDDVVAYVKREEGTYNPETNRFVCDADYIAIGMPSAPGGWKAP